MAYMTQSGLMSDVRDQLARAATGYTGAFDDGNGNPSAEWATFRASDPSKQAAWASALAAYQGAGTPDIAQYIQQTYGAPSTGQPANGGSSADASGSTPAGVTQGTAATAPTTNQGAIPAPGGTMWKPDAPGTGGQDYNQWVNQVGPDGLTNNQRAARQAGYTGQFGQGGHIAFLGQDATKWQSYNTALQNSWGAANAPAPAAPATTTTTGTTAPAAGQSVDTMMGNLVNNPSLPAGTAINPQLQGTNQGEFQQTPTVNPTQTADATAAQVTAAQSRVPTAQDANTYQATQVGNNTPQVQAAQGTVTPEMTVQGQITALMEGFDAGNVPAWAAPAMRRAMATLNARGLGASSLAGQAVIQAAMESALPIAAADATAYQQMAALNLNNEQQARLANTQNRVQALFNDQAQDNTAKQINAASENQVKQFYDSLLANVREFNTAQVNSMAQSNMSEANKQQQFNQSLADQRERFNVQNQVLIDQSNVAWRRQINTNNTAAINAANQTNAQNLLNISNTALNNIWQQFRDNADYAFTASENAATRASNMAIAAFQKDAQFQLLNQEQQNQFGRLIGSTIMNILSAVI